MSDFVSQDTEVSSLWKLYENGRGYLSSMGLSTKLPRYNRFYEGDEILAAACGQLHQDDRAIEKVLHTRVQGADPLRGGALGGGSDGSQ